MIKKSDLIRIQYQDDDNITTFGYLVCVNTIQLVTDEGVFLGHHISVATVISDTGKMFSIPIELLTYAEV